MRKTVEKTYNQVAKPRADLSLESGQGHLSSYKLSKVLYL